MCKICGVDSIKNYKPIKLFTDDEIDRHIKNIFDRITTTRNLDPYFYKKTAEQFTAEVYKGFGSNLDDNAWDSPEYKMLFDLRENVYIFSAAKQYQEIRAIDPMRNGIRDYKEFYDKARSVFDKYNTTYLTVEASSAVLQSQAAAHWMQYEKTADILPMLTYHTVGDSRVRPEHKYLDGITRPVNDKFWDKYFPPLDWNCRCTTLQTDDAVKTLKKDFSDDTKKALADVPEIFQFNPGKERIVFSNKHPYYDVANKDREFAKTNFGMGLPTHNM